MYEIYYLIGCALGDATTSFRKQKGYREGQFFDKFEFSIETIDKEFTTMFATAINKVYGTNIQVSSKIRRSHCKGRFYESLFHRAMIQQKAIVTDIYQKVISLDISKLTREEIAEILRGMFDSDGSFSYTKQVSIRWANEKDTATIFDALLDRMGVRHTDYAFRKDSPNLIFVQINATDFRKNLLPHWGGHITIERKDKKLQKWMVEKYGGKNSL